jgi:hypothetical protein
MLVVLVVASSPRAAFVFVPALWATLLFVGGSRSPCFVSSCQFFIDVCSLPLVVDPVSCPLSKGYLCVCDVPFLPHRPFWDSVLRRQTPEPVASRPVRRPVPTVVLSWCAHKNQFCLVSVVRPAVRGSRVWAVAPKSFVNNSTCSPREFLLFPMAVAFRPVMMLSSVLISVSFAIPRGVWHCQRSLVMLRSCFVLVVS